MCAMLGPQKIFLPVSFPTLCSLLPIHSLPPSLLQPLDWPYKNLTMSVYGAEEAEWEGGWLKDVPKRFTHLADFVEC